ncbi:Putative nicotinamide N-methyltransferase [Leucoagaricus sp. SymC.cos]|nr:Putative nicotinamide N-methyltransferase [Leucoagaricus sp. SymC.cos]
MSLEHEPENSEDILNDALSFLGGTTILEDDSIHYGPLTLTVASKANTLLADHVFSPALFLAERIERQLLAAPGSTASLVVVTDYPDDGILGNLQKNVERNRAHFNITCQVKCAGYAWGNDPQPLLDFLSNDRKGYDIVILSDLLHFDSFHDILLASATALLAQTPTAHLHVAAGNYTRPHVCDSFITKARKLGLVFEEMTMQTNEEGWLGRLEVRGFDNEALSLRKAACRYWVGHRM